MRDRTRGRCPAAQRPDGNIQPRTRRGHPRASRSGRSRAVRRRRGAPAPAWTRRRMPSWIPAIPGRERAPIGDRLPGGGYRRDDAHLHPMLARLHAGARFSRPPPFACHRRPDPSTDRGSAKAASAWFTRLRRGRRLLARYGAHHDGRAKSTPRGHPGRSSPASAGTGGASGAHPVPARTAPLRRRAAGAPPGRPERTFPGSCSLAFAGTQHRRFTTQPVAINVEGDRMRRRDYGSGGLRKGDSPPLLADEAGRCGSRASSEGWPERRVAR